MKLNCEIQILPRYEYMMGLKKEIAGALSILPRRARLSGFINQTIKET
jgi:hypothetical protein